MVDVREAEVTAHRGRGRPRRAGRAWHRAILAWIKIQNLRTEYRYRGKLPGQFGTPYERALEAVATDLGYRTSKALERLIARSLASAPLELQASLPDHRVLDAVYADTQDKLRRGAPPFDKGPRSE